MKWMTNGWRAVLLALALMPGMAGAADTELTGAWLRDNHTVKIAVTQCGNELCSVNTWVKRPNGPEKIGDRLIINLKPVAAGRWRGRAYDLRRRMTYSIRVTLQGSHLLTSGCILFGLLCRSTGWQRIPPANPVISPANPAPG